MIFCQLAVRTRIPKYQPRRALRVSAKTHHFAKIAVSWLTPPVAQTVPSLRSKSGVGGAKLFALLGGLAISGSALGAEWAIEPAVLLRTEYNDNLRLTLAPHDPVTLSRLSPQIALRKKTEISDVALHGLVNLNRYWNEPSFNSTDYISSLSASLFSERSQFTLNANYVRDSTLASELTETGIVAARTQRSSTRVNPRWSWSVSPLSSVGVSYSFADVGYAGDESIGLTAYRNQDLSIYGSHKLGERDELQLGASYSQYETRPAAYESDTLGITLSYTRDFSESTKFSGQIGAHRTKSSRQALTQVFIPTLIPGSFQVVLVPQQIDSNDSGALFSIGLDSKSSARTTLRGRISRELMPSGSRSLIQSDRISAGIAHGFTERTNLSVDASAYRSRFSDETLIGSNRRYYALEALLSSRLDEHWSVSAGYRYARQKYEGANATAVGNVIFLSARYDWTKIAMSR